MCIIRSVVRSCLMQNKLYGFVFNLSCSCYRIKNKQMLLILGVFVRNAIILWCLIVVESDQNQIIVDQSQCLCYLFRISCVRYFLNFSITFLVRSVRSLSMYFRCSYTYTKMLYIHTYVYVHSLRTDCLQNILLILAPILLPLKAAGRSRGIECFDIAESSRYLMASTCENSS